jgi:hypothetical protein
MSASVFETLRGDPGDRQRAGQSPLPDDDDDGHIALWTLYELHYRGFDGVNDRWGWDPGLLEIRRQLEDAFEADLRSRIKVPELDLSDFGSELLALIDDHEGPSVAAFVRREATEEQVRELLRYRSIYHLKESDPTAWVVARLPTVPKAALMELQYDEYGTGDPYKLHSNLFAKGMAACGLDSSYGAYVDDAPTTVLELNNAMSMFGLHRRWTGAALGHLAAFEATSSGPSRRMAQGLDRLGFPEQMRHYYDEHVEADAVHEQLAAREICGSLVAEEPSTADDIVFGALVCLDLEDRFADRLLTRWEST